MSNDQTIFIEIYNRTTFQVKDKQGILLDFRPSDPDLKHKLPQKPFAVITAWNPMNQVLSDHDNRRRNARLEAILKETAYTFYKTLGSLDRHFEESFTIEDMSRIEALDLGRQFEQCAILHSVNAHPEIVFLSGP